MFFAILVNTPYHVTADVNEKDSEVIVGFGPFDARSHYMRISYDSDPSEADVVPLMPETIPVFLEGREESIELPVRWECITGDFGRSDYYYYQFSPKWDEESYHLAQYIELWREGPYIGVFITEDEDIAAASASGIANETAIFNYLTNRGYNAAVACGILANIYSESGFSPTNLQNSYERLLGYTDDSYTAAVDNGSYGNFVYDSAGYGLCQWTYFSRKQNLLDFKNNRGCSIGNLTMQLDFMMQEFTGGYGSLHESFLQRGNSSEVAYSAGYDWCYYYERPAGYDSGVSDTRGNLARDMFWPEYSGFSFDVNGLLDSMESGTLGDYGTVDVYLNDSRVADDVNDYYLSSVASGTKYRIEDVKPRNGYAYRGVTEGQLSGTINGNVSVRLLFSTLGEEMASGYERAIPDGDYLIANAGSSDKSSFMYVDIEGTDVPAEEYTNVSLCGPLHGDPPSYEVWTVKYRDGFYDILQKDAQYACLNVAFANQLAGGNVNVGAAIENWSSFRWAVSSNGRNGYRLESKCSGFSLDVKDGRVNVNGANIQQWPNDQTDAQSWLFIPFQPSQPIEDGRYILVSGVDGSAELDVPGDSGDILEQTVLQVWEDTCSSQYNSFDIEKLSNGYYKIIHHASGKVMGVYGGGSSLNKRVSLFTEDASNFQQWAITPDGLDGGYFLRVKSSGYALDLIDAKTENGSQVRQHMWNGTDAQAWKFVKAEYAVAFDANGGRNAPSQVVKYYKTGLKLPEEKPVRQGFEFAGWSEERNGMPAYAAGGIYTKEQDMTLYACWRTVIPQDGSGSLILPANLTEVGEKAFLGTAPNLVVIPNKVKGIEAKAFADNEKLYSLFMYSRFLSIASDAFENCPNLTVYGYSDSSAEYYCNAKNIPFVPLSEGMGQDWILEDQLPVGATVTDEKWTYKKSTTEMITSTATSLSGWTPTGNFIWQETGRGIHQYASFPNGFHSENTLYSKYNKRALAASTATTTKREVSNSSFQTYIYWHWCWTDYVGDSNRNVTVSDQYGYDSSDGRNYIYFDAFESAVSLSSEGMGRSGLISLDGMYSTYHYDQYNLAEYASWWWWRVEVYQQTYTDYQKVFEYTRTIEEELESSIEIQSGNGISEVRHWVKYSLP